jgi:hypothetical protein
MICQACGIEAPTKYVAFYQNIGALVVRFSKSMEGNLCRPCISSTFWNFTLVTLFFGPWGMISLIVAPCFVINNVVRFVGALGLEPPAPGAAPPQLTDDVFKKLKGHTSAIFDRLNGGEDLALVAADVGPRAGVTPGQVVRYTVAVIEAAKKQNGQQ